MPTYEPTEPEQGFLFELGEAAKVGAPSPRGKPAKVPPPPPKPGVRWEPDESLLESLRATIGLATEGRLHPLDSAELRMQSHTLGEAASQVRDRLLSTPYRHAEPASAGLRAIEMHSVLLMESIATYLRLIADDTERYVESSTAPKSKESEMPLSSSAT